MLNGRRPRTKTTEQLLNELETLYKLGYRKAVSIVDDNFIGNKKMFPKIGDERKEGMGGVGWCVFMREVGGGGGAAGVVGVGLRGW